MKRSRAAAAGVLAGVLAVATAACSGGSTGGQGGGADVGASETNCQNTIVNADAPVVTYWSWLAEAQDVVDHFNETHDDVQVCWTNAGAGADQYTKLTTALESGSGAPDVVQVEYDWLNSFVIRGALLDLTEHGADEYEDRYTPGAWRDASSGDAVYGIPLDLGPVGLFYRQDVLDEAGVDVPRTWAELADAAEKIQASGVDALAMNFPIGGNGGGAGVYSLFDQAGAEPFSFDASKPDEISINVNDEASKRFIEYWFDLIDRGLVGHDQAFSPELASNLGSGRYAMHVGAVWYSGHIPPIAPDQEGEWRAAPLPQWDAAAPVEVNWGGSTFAVTNQADDPELATRVAAEIYGDETALKLAVEKGALFPANVDLIESDYFTQMPFEYYGEQPIMGDVFLPAAQEYEGVSYSPFSTFYYDEMARLFSAAVEGQMTGSEALDALQESLEQYATSQGFTVN